MSRSIDISLRVNGERCAMRTSSIARLNLVDFSARRAVV